ncbi:2-C-methyl-D-erythritol 4-phosphate cytidylyltransferase [Oceanicoccus sagamiensis]|uniref:2-C-methyl-D-erythritol 4-phosphate cytidylyltransferase n=1 Tax=Oceanicoccus sagamiensis TaxID=716816 RepID=A0A1X9N3H3_9GAMM|nr:2-C-methyl-D-erythritol 4-phosphate cytidylyltransferase [Oceanicoccus sagamiensis]ARN72750.1 2-C-methyl-D-erythritol 4-phosphate cytidylyltransferase [Oceanicoccus sagamiensis]
MSSAHNPSRFFAVVPAAGVGKRMGSDTPKQYLPLLGKTVIEYTLTTLLAEPLLERIIVTTSPEDNRWRSLALLSDPRIDVVAGGAERCHSVLNGLQHLSSQANKEDWVLVHDVARPCIAGSDIKQLIADLSSHAVGGILAVPMSDTVKQVDGKTITSTVDRSLLWRAQTPQMFRYQLLLESLSAGIEQGLSITDEASAIELAGYQAEVVEAMSANIKITRPEDLALAEHYLKKES